MNTRNLFMMTAAAALVLPLWRARRRQVDLSGQTALVTGGSRGLGFILARELSREGCRVAICARHEAGLARAKSELAQQGVEVLAIPCDVSDPAQVERMIGEIGERFGPIDILINNAGVIQVGPIENCTVEDFEQALDILFWGALHTIRAVLPQMLARRQGRIVNITSIGGKVSIPHLVPYSTAKFAAVGLSEGLRAELAGKGISVTTIVPGLMRTGSYLHALFRGKQTSEYTLFTIMGAQPGISMDAERAARQIVAAAKHREAERILSVPAFLMAKFHGLFPGLTAIIAGKVSSLLLPDPSQDATTALPGLIVQRDISGPQKALLERLTILGQRAAQNFNQYPES